MDNSVETVVRFLLDGAGGRDIAEFLQNGGLSAAAAADVIDAAFEHMVDAANIDPEARRGWCIEAMRDIYRRLVESGDYTGAIRAIKEISILSGANKRPMGAKTTRQRTTDRHPEHIRPPKLVKK